MYFWLIKNRRDGTMTTDVDAKQPGEASGHVK